MRLKYLAVFCCTFFNSTSLLAGIIREDISRQDYRDFAENLGKYAVGKQNVEVFKTDGTSAGVLAFPIPDFGAVNTAGYATLISPSYVASVKHNGGYKTVDFGNNAKFKTTYSLINRNDDPGADFHVPRLNKVVTEAAPVPYISSYDLSNTSRYKWFARVGGGVQKQVNPETQQLVQLAGAYSWKTAGAFVSPSLQGYKFTWRNNSPDTPGIQPLDIAAQSGDSGSPIFVYDSLDKEWKLVGVLVAGGGTYPYNVTSYGFGPDIAFLEQVIAANTDPDVTDSETAGDIFWGKDAIRQGDNSWVWHGVNKALPSAASTQELDASKDLRFNGDGGTIVLEQSVNHGAAKLQFSGDYQVKPTDGESYTWVGGGVEVDSGKTVLWQVNGLTGDTLHKIGEGTLHVNATGVNGGALNVGDGTVILDQQADQNGSKQAFSSVTLVSGRPVVVLADENQVATQNIQFGYRGGTLDINGNSLSFSEIKHNDDGAVIVNRNSDKTGEVTLYGNGFNFLGRIGEKDSGDLNLIYDAADSTYRATLAGGADVTQLAVKRGELVLSGQQTHHAGRVFYSDDWIEETYRADSVEVHAATALTVSDHASLDANTTVADNATLNLYAHASLAGSVVLAEKNSLLKADISERASTVAGLSSTITADISGNGQLIKTGEGILQVDGNIDTVGDTELQAGTMALNGNVTSTVNMASGTVLAGSGTLQELNTADGSTIYPGALLDGEAEYATLRLASLNTAGTANLNLNSAFSRGATDKLLVEGDISDGDPIMININGQSLWVDSDSNNNGVADNTEGVSIVQVGGKSTKERFKLAGEYVARGAWAYGLYAFAPGKSAESEREVSGSGDQYWDYRLQNIMLEEGDNATPSAPEEIPEVVPEETPEVIPEEIPQVVPEETPEAAPEETPETAPEKTPETAPEETPAAAEDTTTEADSNQPGPAKPVRRAVTPQVPGYISLPSAFFRAEEQRTILFKESALDAVQEGHSRFFLFGYRGEENFKSANNFMQYGYDYKSRYKGWMIGANLASWQNDSQSLHLSGAWSKGDMTFTPSAADGYSQGNFNSDAVNLMVAWRYEDYYLDVLSGYGWSKGSINTKLRGKVASPKVKQIFAEIEGGKTLHFGAHRIRPYVGYRHQQLHVKGFTDVDNARVSYQQQRREAWTSGLGYDYTLPVNPLGNLRLGTDISLVVRPSGQGKVTIGDGQQSERFRTGNGGDSLNLKTEAKLDLNSNIALTAQVRHQRKLQREGANDWLFAGGINITF